MDGFDVLVKLIFEHGSALAIIAYFLYKDYRFNGQIIDLLAQVKEVLVELKTWHAAEDDKR